MILRDKEGLKGLDRWCHSTLRRDLGSTPSRSIFDIQLEKYGVEPGDLIVFEDGEIMVFNNERKTI